MQGQRPIVDVVFPSCILYFLVVSNDLFSHYSEQIPPVLHGPNKVLLLQHRRTDRLTRVLWSPPELNWLQIKSSMAIPLSINASPALTEGRREQEPIAAVCRGEGGGHSLDRSAVHKGSQRDIRGTSKRQISTALTDTFPFC